jgi:hypothetical protein
MAPTRGTSDTVTRGFSLFRCAPTPWSHQAVADSRARLLRRLRALTRWLVGPTSRPHISLTSPFLSLTQGPRFVSFPTDSPRLSELDRAAAPRGSCVGLTDPREVDKNPVAVLPCPLHYPKEFANCPDIRYHRAWENEGRRKRSSAHHQPRPWHCAQRDS